MFGFFKTDPKKKLDKEYKKKLTEAMNAQRSGNIQEYSRLSAEAEKIREQMESMKD